MIVTVKFNCQVDDYISFPRNPFYFLIKASITPVAQSVFLVSTPAFFSMVYKNLCIFPLFLSRSCSNRVLRLQWQYVFFQ